MADKNKKTTLKNKILSYLAYLIINFVCATSKIIRINKETVDELKSKFGSVIYAFWHGRQFVLVYSHRFENISIMTSYSADGELQTNILSKFGYDLVRGSHKKRGAVEATLELIKKIEKGQDIAFAVDGPHGPGFQVKPGTLFIAQKTGKPIIPVSTSAKYKKILSNWDRYLIPAPFNKCVIVYGKPIEVKPEDDLELKSKELETALNEAMKSADSFFD